MTVPAGPVHLNAPMREPLVPDGPLAPDPAAEGLGQTAHTRAVLGARRVTGHELAGIAAELRGRPRGVIVCGPLDTAGLGPAVARLAAATGYPVIADVLSNVRFGGHDRSAVVTRADAILRARTGEVLRPQVIVRFGAAPVSRVVLEWITGSGAYQIVVDDGGWTDPTLLPVTMVRADPVAFAEDLAPLVATPGGSGATDWLARWQAAERTGAEALDAWLTGLDEPFEGAVAASLARALPGLPAGTIMVAGNSKPVRDLDAFMGSGPTDVRCMGNRGASGIDGVLSTALGAAAVAEVPVIAIVGDLSFLHDLGALVAARRLGLSATVVLVDNDGGGIFSQLSQAAVDRPDAGLPEHFEELFGTPHGLDLGPVVTALGASHRLVPPGDVGAAVTASLGQPGLKVVAARTDRARDAELHRSAFGAVQAALERWVGGQS